MLPGFGVPGDAARRFPHRGNPAEPHADFFCQCVGVRAARPAQSRLQDQSRSPRIRPGLVVVQVDVQRGGYRIQFMISSSGHTRLDTFTVHKYLHSGIFSP